MHQSELVNNKKAYLIKMLIFVCLVTFSLLMYKETKMILDLLYCFIVLILFLKFISMKLYQ